MEKSDRLNRPPLERLAKERILVIDGAMGTMIQIFVVICSKNILGT